MRQATCMQKQLFFNLSIRTCYQNRDFINTLRVTCYRNSAFLYILKVACTGNGGFLGMTHGGNKHLDGLRMLNRGCIGRTWSASSMGNGQMKMGKKSLTVQEASVRYQLSVGNTPLLPPGYKQTEVGQRFRASHKKQQPFLSVFFRVQNPLSLYYQELLQRLTSVLIYGTAC